MKNNSIPTTKIQNSIKISTLEAFLTSFVVGLSENYFAAYAVQSGHSALASGLLISVPLIIAGALQFILQYKCKILSAASMIQNALVIQCLSLLSLSIIGYFESGPSFIFLLFIYSFYWLGHFSIQPAWNRWITEIVPPELGQNYFAYRNRLSQIGIICGLILGGLLLHLKVIQIPIQYLYLSLFTFSFFCKIFTIYLFSKLPSSLAIIHVSKENLVSIFKKHRNFFKSYSLFNFSIYLSAPYVVGYLLKEKQLNYFNFMLVMLGLFIGKIATSIWLQKTKKQIDPTQLMFIGGLLAAPLPMLWPICQTVNHMIFVHTLSGMAWASWEVGLSLCFFKNILDSEKIETISLYHYIGTLTQVLGTCVSALLINFVLNQNYNLIFILAGTLRFICVLPLRKNNFNEAQSVEQLTKTQRT